MTKITHQEFGVEEVLYDPDEPLCPDWEVSGRRRMRVSGARQLEEVPVDHPLFLVVTLGRTNVRTWSVPGSISGPAIAIGPRPRAWRR